MTAVYAISSAFIFALIFLFRKQAAKSLPFSVSIGIEALAAFLILFAVSLIFFSKESKQIFSSPYGIFWAVLAGIGFAVGVFISVTALRSGTISNVISITSPAQIVFVVLIGVLILHDKLSTSQIGGIILTIIGIFLLSR